MKRMTYVDKDGKQINQSFENRKPLLRFFFVFGTVLPLVLIILIIVTTFQNKKCNQIYDNLKKAALIYAQSELELPEIEGEAITVSIGSLYSEQYLKSNDTDNILCSGNIKITKYKDEYVYTLDVRNCNVCSTDKKYGDWSGLINYFPKNKAIVDVIPYYNYYEREINTTKWSKYYDQNEISEETSEYGINLPIDLKSLPTIPEGSNIYQYEKEDVTYYRYSNLRWKWYDIVGNYSDFSSEQPAGFQNKDTNTEKYSEWSEYSLDYPEEKSYRSIEQATGFKYYYLNENNEKVYFNNGKYTPKDAVDTSIYDKYDAATATLYHYRDKEWRWYNGQKRNYSEYLSSAPAGKPYKDSALESSSGWSSWEQTSHVQESEKAYRVEETKIMTRYRIKYEMLSLIVLDEPLEKNAFENEVNESIKTFSQREDVKLETTYKFRYRK